MEVRKFSENDTYEFYDSRGTYSDAQEVQKTLKDKYGKDGTLQLDPVYGWIVRVKKNNKTMSYYCKGEICQRAKKCLRATAWDEFPKNGTTDGVWFVPENTCIKNNYEDGVFETD